MTLFGGPPAGGSSSSASGCNCVNCPTATCCFTFTISGVTGGSCCTPTNATWTVYLNKSFTFYCLWESGITDPCEGFDYWELYYDTGTTYYLSSSEGYYFTCTSFDCVNGGLFDFTDNFGSCTGSIPTSVLVSPCGGGGSQASSSSIGSSSSSNIISSSSSMGCPCCCCGSSSSSSSSGYPITTGCASCPGGTYLNWTITVTGWSAGCSSFNGTFNLAYVNNCLWESTQEWPSTQPYYTLNSGGTGELLLTASNSDGSNACTWFTFGGFNCLGSTNLPLDSNLTACTAPASITVNPA